MENLLKKLTAVILILVMMFINMAIVVEASTIEPTDDQYLELKATNITEVEGKNKQVIMELWGHEIDFKRI
ncbi:MAG TPA: hypothetical protein OIM49_03060 [Clostridiaceae bacterium]|jgi:hypothetical protein|nr:hypothetical protein [Clostridiaceae bacterium]